MEKFLKSCLLQSLIFMKYVEILKRMLMESQSWITIKMGTQLIDEEDELIRWAI